MKINDYKKMYEKMETSEDMDKRILSSVQKKRRMQKTTYMKIAGVAAAFAIMVGVYQIPSVNAAVNNFINGFTNKVTIENETIEMNGEYLTLNQNAYKENKKFDTIADVEKEIGVNILKSPNAYEDDKNLIQYNPHVSDDGDLYGVILMDDFYCIGDLKNVKTRTYSKFEDGNGISYNSGKKYSSPIGMEITIRATTLNSTNNLEDGEVDYHGEKVDMNTQDNAEVYEIKNLGVKAVISTKATDGPSDWEDMNESGKITDVMFVYDGVEYVYFGAVSPDTMKEFLEELSY